MNAYIFASRAQFTGMGRDIYESNPKQSLFDQAKRS